MQKKGSSFDEYLPITEPYSALGATLVGDAGISITDTTILSKVGNEAITDWVIVYVRDNLNHANIILSRIGLIRSDGKISILFEKHF